MKTKTTLIVLALALGFSVNAQVINPKETAKRKAEDRANRKTDQGIDKGLDKIEEGIGNIFKKKDKKEQSKKVNKNDNPQSSGYDSPTTTTDKQGNTDYSAYKDFDFVAGENIIFFENFEDNSKKRWGATDSNEMNIIPLENMNWLNVKGGNFFPLGLQALPKDFTLEFDAYAPNGSNSTLDIRFIDKSQANALADPWLDNSSLIHFSPISQIPKTGLGGYLKKINNQEISPTDEFKFISWQPELGQNYARISLSCTNNRISVWVNKEQVMENIDLLAGNKEYLMSFHLQTYFVPENRMALTNFRLATGNANPKSEMETTKKFVTQNIYFDVNSDVIRPNSYATLKKVAESIQATDGNILIVGHTDSDGADAANLVLSQKRSASVKRALSNEFGIDPNRLTTDGKGESVPLNKNATPSEKAQNRRVEFIKL